MLVSIGSPIPPPKADHASSAMSISPAVRAVADRITPNPGGVGPMTIAMLLQNTALAAEQSVK